MSPRYAATTSTPVSYSQNEMRKVLDKAGVQRQMLGSGPEGDLIGFEFGGRQFKFIVRRPTLDDATRIARADGVVLNLVRDWDRRIDQEYRRRWRAAVLWLKATLEFTDGDQEALERVLLGSMVLPDGRTFSQWARPQIEVMYDRGDMPALLGPGVE